MQQMDGAQLRFGDQTLDDRSGCDSIKLPKVTTKKTEVLIKQVKEAAKKDATIGTNILREWIGEASMKEY